MNTAKEPDLKRAVPWLFTKQEEQQSPTLQSFLIVKCEQDL
jgi:hypothetical protein